MIVNSSTAAEAIYAHFGFTVTRVEEKTYRDGGHSRQVWMKLTL